jgi:hypothetical protein
MFLESIAGFLKPGDFPFKGGNPLGFIGHGGQTRRGQYTT